MENMLIMYLGGWKLRMNDKYYDECKDCPYFKQHYLQPNDQIINGFIPLEMEFNNSDILLIFQAPGINEWQKGDTIVPTHVKGGTAGIRILNSWDRKKKVRSDFDIVESVRCYPGKRQNGRDKKPRKKAKKCCSKILEREISNGNYSKIIAFGMIAQEMLKEISIKNKCTIINAIHPNGGISKVCLDSLW